MVIYSNLVISIKPKKKENNMMQVDDDIIMEKSNLIENILKEKINKNNE